MTGENGEFRAFLACFGWQKEDEKVSANIQILHRPWD